MTRQRRDPKFASIGLVELGEELAEARKGKQRPPEPTSLVGRFFHGSNEQQWQGEIIGHPSTDVYLVEMFSWLHGGSCGQQLVALDDMREWTFYSSAEDMNFAYEYGGVAERWKRYSETRPDPEEETS